ncbi:nucleotide sugar dehydrogenase [Maricaulis sp.]|uniref:nucleotide sugar dehydrogenase n=1 Tax=Maricaulis sp. TaxID=1486257 RepID=UPI001B1F4DAD|nr:nucleotide sugar dehydrogenase [Maricaulis sp.]MBO6796517.1 nucleotide sugar dehydrogenase [Maricaulis sp.]
MNAPTVAEFDTLDTLALDFERRATNKTLTVGVIGLGYVGLPLAQAFCRQDIRVIGFDVSEFKIKELSEGRSYIKHIKDEAVKVMIDTDRFEATTDFDRLDEPDALLICVPTPLDKHRDPDLDYVIKSTEAISKKLRRGQIVVLESTTYPGTSEEVMKPILEGASGLVAGLDFAIAYSPEREDPGNPQFETSTIPKVVGANTSAETRMAVTIYQQIVPQVVPVRDLRTAEAVKLTENIYRAVNIGLVNELKTVYGAMGIDVWEVIQAASTKPFGFHAFYPGPGLGGHCIPIDPFYLSWKAREFGLSTRFIELAGEVNNAMPGSVVNTVAEELSTRLEKSLKGARVLLCGLAYKKNVDDMRESPSLLLLEQLEARGAVVDYYDPYIPVVPYDHDHPEYEGRKSVDWTPESLSQFDVALIATDHDKVDYGLLLNSVPFVVDTRNATAMLQNEHEDRIVKA